MVFVGSLNISIKKQLVCEVELNKSNNINVGIQEQENTTKYTTKASTIVQDVELLCTNRPPNSTPVVAGQLSLTESPVP